MISEVIAAAPSLSVRQLCALLDVNRAWYYARPVAGSDDEDGETVRLRDAIERIVLDFPGYGYRRVTHALAREGWAVNHKRVLRVMREDVSTLLGTTSDSAGTSSTSSNVRPK